jgi:hypothetical protein
MEGSWFKANLDKKFERPPSQLIPEYGGTHLSSQLHRKNRRRIVVQTSLGKKKCQILFQKSPKQKGLGAWIKW